jgi:hypothetical protein
MSQDRPRGLYFEEFTLGQEIDSPARTVTEADVMLFAGLSGDYNPLHTDVEYAARRPTASASPTACWGCPSPRGWPPGPASSRAPPWPLPAWNGSSRHRFCSVTPSACGPGWRGCAPWHAWAEVW